MKVSRIAALFWMVAALSGLALAGGGDRKLLRGITQVKVIVDLSKDGTEAGLDAGALKTAVESQLRKAGIAVADDSRDWLYVNLGVVKGSESGLCAVAYSVEVWQAVRLLRDPSIASLSATWRTGTIGIYGSAVVGEAVRTTLADRVDAFIADYQAANAPAAPTPNAKP
jgi:hypothetical protein